jgi:hypothetical protein
MKRTGERDKRYAHRRVHEIGDEAARQCDFSDRSAHRSAQVPATGKSESRRAAHLAII